MTSHHDYHLILCAQEEECALKNSRKPHLSLGKSEADRKHRNPNSVCQVPEWNYEKKDGSDQVTLEVPGILKEDIVLYIAKRNLFLSALRYKNLEERKIDCEFFFKMRLADDSDVDGVTFTYSNGMLALLIPRMKVRVRKIVPAFVYDKDGHTDVVRLEMAGVKRQDVKCRIKNEHLSIRAMRYNEAGGVRKNVVEYVFNIKMSNALVKNISWNLEDGILTTCIPRDRTCVKRIIYPRIDENRQGKHVFELVLPGVNEKDIKLETIGNVLNVEADAVDADDDLHSRKKIYAFRKEFSEQFDIENVESKFKDGILFLSISRDSKK